MLKLIATMLFLVLVCICAIVSPDYRRSDIGHIATLSALDVIVSEHDAQ